MAATKRRLPVLQPKDDEGESRPPWQWTAIGGATTMLVLLPLAMATAWLARHTYGSYVHGATPAELQQSVEALTAGQRIWLSLLSVVAPLFSLAVASVAGGALVGRFGGAAGKREAALGAVLAAAVSSAIAARGFIAAPGGAVLWLFTSVVMFVVSGAMGLLGGVAGLRLRR